MTKPETGGAEGGREGVPCAALPAIILCITADTLLAASRVWLAGWLVKGWVCVYCILQAFTS